MTTLHLGVLDVAYSNAPTASARVTSNKATLRRLNSKTPPKAARTSNGAFKTTGDVAAILEAKYHVMDAFFTAHQDEVIGYLEKGIEGALQNLALGAPGGNVSFSAEAESEIETRFRQFLSLREMDHLNYPGVPTRAAQLGVSHRFAHPYARRGSRPSFIDTGLYQASFRAWID